MALLILNKNMPQSCIDRGDGRTCPFLIQHNESNACGSLQTFDCVILDDEIQPSRSDCLAQKSGELLEGEIEYEQYIS